MDPPENEELTRALKQCHAARIDAERKAAASSAVAAATVEEMQHFIYAVSHDLRTPLRSVLSYAQLLQRQYPENGEANELVALITDGANQMNGLVEDVLKYSRVGSSTRRTTLNLRAVVQFALFNLQPLIKETGAEITIGDLPEAAIDESQFVQLFGQIISNALKFRGEEAPRVAVTATEDAEGHTISVRDNGPGIRKEFHELVFAPFKRLCGREVPGTGLGLAISRKIVGAHGGKIWVESDGLHGSEFKFTIPS